MAISVKFNGQVLVKAGGATKVDASAFASASLAGNGTVAVIGEADKGAPGEALSFTSANAMKAYFGSGPLADAADIAFNPANDNRIGGGASEVIAIKVNASTQSSKTFDSNGSAYAQASSGVAPFVLATAQTLVMSFDGGADVTATFTGVAPSVAAGGAGPYTNLADSDVLDVVVDGGPTQSLTITGLSTKTAAEVAAILNPLVVGGSFYDDSGTLKFKSDTQGIDGTVAVTGGTANGATKLNFASGTVTGTGNVGNILNVTAAEGASIAQAAITAATQPGTATVSGSGFVLASTTINTGTVQVKNTSTATGFGFDNTVHSAGGLTPALLVTSREYGAATKKIGLTFIPSGLATLITVFDGSTQVRETSPALGGLPELTVTYSGNSVSAVLAVSETELTVTLSGAQTDGTEDLVVPFSEYATVNLIIDYINAQLGYSAVASSSSNPYTLRGDQLDIVTNGSALGSSGTLYASLFRCEEWLNTYSSLVTAERVSGGVEAPITGSAFVYLTGGARGTSNNTAWQNAYNLLGSELPLTVVPLMSRDLSALGQGSTATFASVAAMHDAHCAYYSSTAGKKEREGYLGMRGSKSDVQTQAQTLSSCHTVLSSNRVTRLNAAGEMTKFDEWAFALQLAAMRCGAELGEPLTWKYIRADAIEQDSSWSPTNDGVSMILSGVTYAELVPRKGIRIERCLTTYTRDSNDAYREESVVMGWKNVSYELRTYLEDLFVGGKLSPSNIAEVRSAADSKLSELWKAGQIVESVLPDGTRRKAWWDLEVYGANGAVYVNVNCSPVEGITFMLNNIFVVPAVISA